VATVNTDPIELPDDGDDDVVFSDDEEVALLVALLRWRGPE
jgi:hypothetical protein